MAPPSPHWINPSRWSVAMVVSVGAIVALAALAWVFGGAFDKHTGTLGTAPQPALLRYTAQLTSQALNDKQRLLDAYANSLGQIDTSDSLATKQWLNSHGDLVSRLFEETWLVFLPAANSHAALPLAQASLLLRPGQAAVATPLSGAMGGKFSDMLSHKLSTSIEMSYLMEQGQAHVVHASPALNKQGVPIAVLVALTPLSSFLSSDGLGCLNNPSAPPMLPMPWSTAVLGPFIANADQQVLATSAGQNIQQLQALLRKSGPRLYPTVPQLPHTDYTLQWQRIAGTSWQMGLVTPLAGALAATPASGVSRFSTPAQEPVLNGSWLSLGIALLVGLLAALAYWLRRRSALAASRSTAAPWSVLDASKPRYARQAALGEPSARGAHTPNQHVHSTATGPVSLGLAQLKHSSQCLVLLRHDKIQAMSQGALEFLQFSQAPDTPRAIQSLLAQPQDYQRLHIMIDAAAQDEHPFSFMIEIRDALGFHHVVYAQAYKPTLHAQHQRLILFEDNQARLARLCPASLLPQLTPELDPTSHLPTFSYWHALLQGLLRLGTLQAQAKLGTAAQPAAVPGYVLYLAIDGFASLSSQGGSAFSEEALRYSANAITYVLSQQPYRHLLGHIQKEQFALACLGIDELQARQLAKQLQYAIAHLQASYLGAPILLSISVGIAALPQQLSALDAHLNAADLACFDAASKGLQGLEIASLSSAAQLTA